MAINVKVMTWFVTLYVTVNRSGTTSTSICYKIPPSNNPSPPILNTYRQRYDFIQKFSASTGSSSRRRSAGSSAISTKCPWQWAIDDNPNRFPRTIPYAKCDNCDKIVCKPVKFSHQVLYQKCDYRTGEITWRWAGEGMTVAFVYTK